MDSLVFLCARKVVSDHPGARRALPLIPAELYPALFRAAFLDGRTLALRDLVAAWPYPVLSLQRLLAHLEHHHRKQHCQGFPRGVCVQTVIIAIVAQLQQALEEPWHDTSERRCCLRLVDMTDLQDYVDSCGPEGTSLLSNTVALAKACLEVSKHQRQHQKRGSKRHKGPGGPSAAPPPLSVEVRADLFVNCTCFGLLREALRSGSSLRLRCRDLRAEELSAGGTVALLECLEPSGVRRVDLRFNNLGLLGISTLLPHLSKFPDLQSLWLPYSNVDVRRLMPGVDSSLQQVAAQLGRLPKLKELNLGSSRLSGNLRQLLSELQSPLESLELAFCSLLPSDLTFLHQSIHAPALKKLDLSGQDFTLDNLLQPLQQLLEVTSASLLHLDLMECHLTDTHLEALLPALCHCSRLRCLGLFGNFLTTPALRNLVRRTVTLLDLHLVIYPYPLDCYLGDRAQPPSGWHLEDAVDRECFAAVAAELQHLLVSSGRAEAVWSTSLCQRGALDYFSL
ncbi:LRC14 protein, partial [Bucco capensis]|nr:LRC14 protein [Bucco capensis]